MLKAFRLVLLVAGLVCIGYLIVRAGPAAVVEPFRALSWWLLPVLVVPYLLVTLCHASGWRFCFTRSRPLLTTLASIRLAGEAFNPMAASVGGEAVKGMLLRPGVPLDEAVASLVVDKTASTLGQGLFLAIGLVIGRLVLTLPSGFLELMLWLLVIEAVALGGFVLVQAVEAVGRGLTAAARAWWPRLVPHLEPLRRVERTVAGFYLDHRGRVSIALLWHLLAWAVASLEVYTVLRVLGREVSIPGALVIEAFVTAVRFLSFMVPANLGALEAGTMLVFDAFGLGAGLGLAVSLIRRLRQIVWVAVGLACLAALRHPVAADP